MTEKSAPVKSEGKKSEKQMSEKAASAQAHVRTSVGTALTGPTQDDLNPAFAPLTADEE